MFARKIQVQLLSPHGPRACPIVWLDSFFMRSFTGRSAFDESLPLAVGLIEVGFGVDLQVLTPGALHLSLSRHLYSDHYLVVEVSP